MNRVVSEKISALQDELFGNTKETWESIREECTEEENAQYKKLQSGDYPKSLPDGIHKDENSEGKYYRENKILVKHDAPTEDELKTLLRYVEAQSAKESASHLKAIRELIAFALFVPTLCAGAALCILCMVSFTSHDSLNGIAELLGAIFSFVLSAKINSLRADEKNK